MRDHDEKDKDARHLLSGMRILDLGTMVAGPVACTLFGDFGAEVIKVEVPGRGDTVRDVGRRLPDGAARRIFPAHGHLSS